MVFNGVRLFNTIIKPIINGVRLFNTIIKSIINGIRLFNTMTKKHVMLGYKSINGVLIFDRSRIRIGGNKIT